MECWKSGRVTQDETRSNVVERLKNVERYLGCGATGSSSSSGVENYRMNTNHATEHKIM